MHACLAHVIRHFYPARACAARGKVIEFVRCLLPVQSKILRWLELATSRTSEHIRSFENTPIILTCTCYWADSLPLAEISAIIRSTLSAILFTAMSYAHNIYSCPRPAINFASRVWCIQHMAKVNESWRQCRARARGVCAL